MSDAAEIRLFVEPEQLCFRRAFDRTLCWDADLPRDVVELIWKNPVEFGAQGDKLQEKLRCSVARIDHTDGQFVWKEHNWGSVRRTVKRSLSPSVARRCHEDGLFLWSSGVPTPRPRAFAENHFGPFGVKSYLLTDYIPGTSLYRFMRFENPSPEEVRDLARQVADIWRRLDELCVWHNDFKTENFLVDPQRRVWLIDLERMRRFRTPQEARRRRVRDANDFLHPRNWRTNLEAAEVFRREILQAATSRETLVAPKGAIHPLQKPIGAVNCDSHLVSVIISCRNAASTIAACVNSARDMADEIIVADSGSSDETVAIARQLGCCRVLQNDCPDDVSFAAWADEQASHSWIFRMNADEQMNAELGRQIQDSLASEPVENGFLVRTAVCFRGRRLKYGSSDASGDLRLYRKEAARYEMRHGQLRVTVESSKLGRIRERLVQNVCSNFGRHLHELGDVAGDRWLTTALRGKKPDLIRTLCRAPWHMFRTYVLRGGCLDGWSGLHASVLSAFRVYLTEALLWESQQPVRGPVPTTADGFSGLKIFDPNGMAGVPRPTLAARTAPAVDEANSDETSGEPRRKVA